MPKNEEYKKELENESINEEISNDVTLKDGDSLEKESKVDEIIKEKEVDKEEKIEESVSEKVKKELPAKKEEKKVDEATVIEKIKSFIAKIVAMQEEAKKEGLDKKELKEEKAKLKDKENKKKEDKKTDYLLEYYDLPYRYNETIVKILAQTPKRLFVYWDLSDNDREKYLKAFGDDFFEKTYPVLLLYNEDKHYVREIPINDFANSWYINIDDPKTKYTIQLGRKFKEQPRFVNMAKVEEQKIILRTDYLPIANSNELEAPNDHVLLESLPRYITFRNVKTNQEIVKDMKEFKDTFGNNYDVKEFYNNEYKEEITDNMFDMANPSSNLSSSSFK